MASEAKPSSAGLGNMLYALCQSMIDSARRALERRRQRRQAMDTYELLNGLDNRTLRDLGFRREEIWSLAAEIAGTAAPSRRQTTKEYK